jgi:hypothetical protein
MAEMTKHEKLVEAVEKIVNKFEPTPQQLGAAVAQVIAGYAKAQGWVEAIDELKKRGQWRPLDLGKLEAKAAKAGR